MTDLKRLTFDASRHAAAAIDGFADRATARGLVDVALGNLESPIGRLTVAVTPRGLVRVIFESEDREVEVEDLAHRLSPRILEAPGVTDDVRRELDAYFAGALHRFHLPLDRRLMSPFTREVLRATARVGYGRLATYGEVAAKIGRPNAARAVGAALGSNPIPIVVPCHRVVGAGGRLTGYAGGLPRKEFLLRLEGSFAV